MYKQIMMLLLFFSTIGANQVRDLCAHKELRLHFDVNKTIIALDSAQGKGVEETVNGILAECTYAQWDGKNEQSYYAYVTDVVIANYPHLSRSDDEFDIQRDMLLRQFPQFLQQYPGLLEQYEYDKQRMLELLSSDGLVIFPSFFKTIQWLNATYPGRYVIYLRTFGNDLPEVIPAITNKCGLQFNKRGSFKGRDLTLTIGQDGLYDLLTGMNLQHYAIQDDYAFWKLNGFQAIGGKPFAVDISNEKIISIFFDDNANNPDKPIIYAFNPSHELQDTQLLLNLGHIVAVDPKEAILDEDYFITKIKKVCDR